MERADYESLDTYYMYEKERHTAEIAAFHLSRSEFRVGGWRSEGQKPTHRQRLLSVLQGHEVRSGLVIGVR